MLKGLFLVDVCPSRGLTKYIQTKVLITSFTLQKALVKNTHFLHDF